MNFRQWIENNVNSNVMGMMQAVINDPEDEQLRLILADAFEEGGHASESQIMRAGDDNSTFHIVVYEQTITWGNTGHPDDYEEETDQIEDDWYNWMETIYKMRQFGGEPSSYPVDMHTASRIWLSRNDEQDYRTGAYPSYSLHVNLGRYKDLPSMIMWMLLKTAKIRGVR